MDNTKRETEKKGKSIFMSGILLAVILGIPASVIGLIIGLIFKWFLLFWIGLGVIGIGIVFFFVGLFVGAGVATNDAEQAVRRLQNIENKGK